MSSVNKNKKNIKKKIRNVIAIVMNLRNRNNVGYQKDRRLKRINKKSWKKEIDNDY